MDLWRKKWIYGEINGLIEKGMDGWRKEWIDGERNR